MNIKVISGRGLDKIREALRKTSRPPPKFPQKRSPKMSGTAAELYVKEAQIINIEPTYYKCKLRRYEDEEWVLSENVIDVYPMKKFGTNSLNENVWPKFAVGDVIIVFKRMNNEWITPVVVDDSDICN